MDKTLKFRKNVYFSKLKLDKQLKLFKKKKINKINSSVIKIFINLNLLYKIFAIVTPILSASIVLINLMGLYNFSINYIYLSLILVFSALYPLFNLFVRMILTPNIGGNFRKSVLLMEKNNIQYSVIYLSGFIEKETKFGAVKYFLIKYMDEYDHIQKQYIQKDDYPELSVNDSFTVREQYAKTEFTNYFLLNSKTTIYKNKSKKDKIDINFGIIR